MYINYYATAQVTNYNENLYIEKIDANYSSDATYNNFIDLFNKMGISIKRQTEKEEIFNMYGDCVYFSKEENENLMKMIRKNKVEKKDNFFDYYD